MKKSFLLVAALLMSTSLLFSQPFEKGDHAVNLGVGLGNPGYLGSYYSFRPSISASYEMGILEVPMGAELTGVVGVGAFLGWAPIKYRLSSWGDTWYWSGNRLVIAARGTYHLIFHDKLDTYAGIFLGLGIETWKWHGDTSYPVGYSRNNKVGFAGGGFLGARWFFTPQIAAFLELGYSISILNLGVTYKIDAKN